MEIIYLAIIAFNRSRRSSGDKKVFNLPAIRFRLCKNRAVVLKEKEKGGTGIKARNVSNGGYECLFNPEDSARADARAGRSGFMPIPLILSLAAIKSAQNPKRTGN